jgi:hypothetical protein
LPNGELVQATDEYLAAIRAAAKIRESETGE